MTIQPTSWRNYVDANTGLSGGKPWPWQYGSDDAIAMDMGTVLDSGETIENAVATLRLIPTWADADYVEADENITNVDVVGNVVLVRLADLDAGRYYKLDVLIGPDGNRRGGNTIVQVST